MGATEGLCRVSVVTPTTESRDIFHQQLWECFRRQTWPDKELIVVETYTTRPSNFFCELLAKDEYTSELGPSVGLVHVPFEQHFSIGLKRNIGIHLASGRIIVQFDDDDLYAPEYIETMVKHLREKNFAAVTLRTWYDFDVHSLKCGFVDP